MATEIADKGIHAGKPMWPSLQTADWLFSVSNIGLIVGLALTVVATVGSVWMANVREGYLKREVAEAAARGDEARADAAIANARALEARVALEKLKAPRTITDEQLQHIAGALSPFAGQQWEVTTYWDLKEPLAFANRLKVAFDLAKWVYVPHTNGTFLLGINTGIEVYVHPQAQDSTQKAAAALVETLNGFGDEFAVELKSKNAPDNPNNMISLNVGVKP